MDTRSPSVSLIQQAWAWKVFIALTGSKDFKGLGGFPSVQKGKRLGGELFLTSAVLLPWLRGRVKLYMHGFSSALFTWACNGPSWADFLAKEFPFDNTILSPRILSLESFACLLTLDTRSSDILFFFWEFRLELRDSV